MEGNRDNGQQQPPIKKEPLRVRSFSSMRQQEQQQLAAAALRLPRVPGQFLPSLQPRDPRLKPHSVSPSPSFSSAESSSSSSGSRATVKFTPNVAVKHEPATGANASQSAAAAAGTPTFGVDALLLRSLHSQQPNLHDRGLHRPKFTGGIKYPTVTVAPPPQSSQVLLSQTNNTDAKQRSKKGPRSLRLCDLAFDDSQGHLILPITIPFRRPLREEDKRETDSTQQQQQEKQEQLDDLEGIDTAASTPEHLRRRETRTVQLKNEKGSEQTSIKLDKLEDTPAALLLKGQSSGGQGECAEEEERPEFVHFCFPQLLPPLDISAMQAQQAQAQQGHQKGEQQTKNSSSSSTANSSRKNCPTPLQALPSGRIGQMLIRRSGRVHLRLLTEASRNRSARVDAAATGECAAAEGAAETGGSTEAKEPATAGELTETEAAAAGTAAGSTPDIEDKKYEDKDRTAAAPQSSYTLRSDDICYDVFLGTEDSFAQEVGCLLSETNEFIFLGRCRRKLVVTADVARAVAALDSRK